MVQWQWILGQWNCLDEFYWLGYTFSRHITVLIPLAPNMLWDWIGIDTQIGLRQSIYKSYLAWLSLDNNSCHNDGMMILFSLFEGSWRAPSLELLCLSHEMMFPSLKLFQNLLGLLVDLYSKAIKALIANYKMARSCPLDINLLLIFLRSDAVYSIMLKVSSINWRRWNFNKKKELLKLQLLEYYIFSSFNV